MTLVEAVRTLTSLLVAGLLLSITAGGWTATDTGGEQVAPSANPSASDNEELHFPREAANDLGRVVIHAPQIESWDDFETLTGATAVEATLAGETKKHVGSAKFEAQTSNDLDNRVVTIHDAEVVAVNFPGASAETTKSLEELVRSVVRTTPQQVPLDLALRSVANVVQLSSIEGLKSDPPKIFYSTEPAILVMIDGDTALGPIEDLRLRFVINTNWDLFFDPKKSKWYLLNDKQWLTTKDLDAGMWTATRKLPKDFKKLPQDKSWSSVKANVPAPETEAPVPGVYVSHLPAELILVHGELKLEAIEGTTLSFVDNTESDLFKREDQWYYLVSGRWFETATLGEGWKPVSELPDDFANIPLDHELASVRASVPGTEEALLAAMEAQIPRKATVTRDAGAQVKVIYQGDPQFVPIEGTSLRRAANTGSDVIKAGDEYYLCANAVWYVSPTALGPWTLTETIPAEIYTIPPSSPVYHTTHVKVYESSPSTVTYGYTPGYYGMYVSFGVAMYGTGWYYPPYYYYPGYGYPIYYPYPYSYGGSSWYNPATGAYGRTGVAYGPYGGYGRSAVYNPETGGYARGAAVWDNDEIAGSAVGYNPRTGTGVATNRYANESGAWGETVVTRGDEWLYTQGEFSDNQGRVEFESSRGTTGEVERTRDGDTITGTGYAERGDRSVTTQTTTTGDETVVQFEGSEGGTGESTRTRGENGITSEGSFQKDGKTVTTDSQITREGARTDFESSTGASGAVGRKDGSNYGVAQSAEGDLYAGKDGNVYKRTDDGWAANENGEWKSVERTAPSGDADRSALSERSGTAQTGSGQGIDFAAESRRDMQSGQYSTGERSMARQDSLSTQSASRDRSSSLQQSLSSSSVSRDRNSQLNRDYSARSGGYQSYNNNYNRQRGSMSGRAGGRGGGRQVGGRRRR